VHSRSGVGYTRLMLLNSIPQAALLDTLAS
jgi:hypothetical protein